MSAECVMAAFYHPDEKAEFREDFPWLPTPIHTAPKGYDKLLNIDDACPRAVTEFLKVRNTPEIQDYNKENEELYKYISEHSGFNVTKVVDVLILFDALRIERWYNLTIPNWAIKKYKEMNIVSDFFYELYSYTLELKRLRAGPLLRTITENMIIKLQNNLSRRKMHIYYQNDTTLVNQPHELNIPGCSFECPLSDWINLIQDVIPQDWEKECKSIDPLQNYSDISYSTENTEMGVMDTEMGEMDIEMAILQQNDIRNITSNK
ncbi:hypothetical protein Anas_01623 [Armadillidium nasatum]|uniref:acid phosphatase n=1 Tax=Armadillidium nasatum TaxID=96803 RepID=A0A5N5TNM8_9CRUS|nr:hypothetical protein Anas_01623 [Armadillidium nasatum]